MNSVQPHILSIPSPFAFENGVLKVLEPPETDQRILVDRLLGGQYEKPYIVDDGYSRSLYFSFAFVQSAMRVSKPNSLELAYTRKMMSFLLFQPHPKNILMLGLGGGSLAKFCYQHLPDTKITVIEINPHVLAFRNEFKIPENSEHFQVMLGDAAEYVASCHSNFDVIATDAFDRHGYACSLCNRAFYENLRRLLTDNGLVVSNMAGRREEKMAHLKMLNDIFGGRTLAVPVGRDDNHVALAFSKPDFEPCWQMVHGRAKSLSKSIGLDFEKFARKFERSKSWITVNEHFYPPSGSQARLKNACQTDSGTSKESTE